MSEVMHPDRILWIYVATGLIVGLSIWARIQSNKSIRHYFMKFRRDQFVFREGSGWLVIRRGLAIVGMSLAIYALARPLGAPEKKVALRQGAEIVLVMDVSRSMRVMDVKPSRLATARRWGSKLLERFGQGRYGLVVFAGSSHRLCPITPDVNIMESYIDFLDSDIVSSKGSNLWGALQLALESFTEIEKNEKEHQKFREEGWGSGALGTPPRAVILLTDGEIHERDDEHKGILKRYEKQGVPIYSVIFWY